MSNQCVNCGTPVTNDTAHGAAPACDDCRGRWATAEINRAKAVLEQAGYTVIAPGEKGAG